MTPNETVQYSMTIEAFLDTSRKYLALPVAPKESAQTPRVSIVPAKLQRMPVNSYRKVVQSFLLAAGFGAFAAAPALADDACDHRSGHQERHAKMHEQHHAKLHDALKLTAEQEPGWKKLLESEQPRPELGGGKPEDWAKLNAPERAEKMLELSKARQARMTEHVAALKSFYATLTPEQQKVFEDFHAAPRGGMAGKPGTKGSGSGKTPAKP